ncbi:MAG: hypothetical protein A2283_01735 [Lentisphaerae bacterium RIFOXYA12_FULL_48_11]|nr:MAG: hypothetical protein A2283_01735 [Lentisphaerae bacterium RIFOXYA12_FULL_48_11]
MEVYKFFPASPLQKQWGLYLTDCGREVIPPHYTIYPPQVLVDATQHNFDRKKRRRVAYSQLVYIRKGQGYYENECFKRMCIKAGTLFFVFEELYCGLYPDQETGWEAYWISFGGEQSKRLMREPFFSPRSPVMELADSARIEVLMRMFIDRVVEEDVYYKTPYSITGQLLDLLGQILEMKEKRAVLPPSDEDRIRRAQAFISGHALEKIDYTKLARQLGMSRRTFWRKFAMIAHAPPLGYQLAIRLNHAQRLLMTTNLSITEIAAHAGFENVYYFSSLFSKKMGISPLKYRQNIGKKP